MLVKTESSMVMMTVTMVACVFYIIWENMLNLVVAAF